MSAKTAATSRSASSPTQAVTMADDAEHGLIAKRVGKWGDPEFPKTGWTRLKEQDLGEPKEKCQMCGYDGIRYVHIMSHPSLNQTLKTGWICAGHLEGNLDAAQFRDKAVRNASKQIATAAKSLERDERILLKKPGLKQVITLHREAKKRADRVEQIYAKYPCDYFFDQLMQHAGHRARIDKEIEKARAKDPQILLQTALDKRIWKRTGYGSSLVLPAGYALRVYEEHRWCWYFFKLKKQDATPLSNKEYHDLEAAQHAGLIAMTSALRKAGLLPERPARQ
jgi:hypothetical protein